MLKHPIIATATIAASFMFILVGMIGYVQFVAMPAAITLAQPGFKASYFNNRTLSKTPVLVRIETEINLTQAPAGLNPEQFSVRWAGNILIGEPGTYTFTVDADDGIRIWIDGKVVLKKWHRNNATYTFDKSLKAGPHFMKVEYFQQYSAYKAKVKWVLKTPTQVSTSKQVKPSTAKPATARQVQNNTSNTETTQLERPTVVVFVTGGGMNQTQVTDLQKEISTFYKARLPQGTPWLILGYDDDIVGEIKKNYPNTRVILLGHSFGGNTAVKAAKDLGYPVELLMIFDPVHVATPGRAENFTIPSNVKKAIAYRRQFVDSTPASGVISNPRSQDKNIIYKLPDDLKRRYDQDYIIGTAHGWAVWQTSIFSTIKSAL